MKKETEAEFQSILSEGNPLLSAFLITFPLWFPLASYLPKKENHEIQSRRKTRHSESH